MENHPIPQDVTSFQFKLIGNMTVKQFAYVATGVVLAAILTQLPVHLLIKLPICVFFATLGLSLAYLPVGGRPMDSMIANYFRALVSPTVFVYDKTGSQDDSSGKQQAAQLHTAKTLEQLKNTLNPLPRDQLKDYLETIKEKPKNKLDEAENNFLTSISAIPAKPLSHQLEGPQEIEVNPASPQNNLTGKSSLPKAQEEQKNSPSTDNPASGGSIKQSFPRGEHSSIKFPFISKLISKNPNKNTSTISPSTSPNMITGVVKDSRGNALSNILIEIKDKDNNPVRAFKTNVVGRFASATPLVDGSYTIELEDPSGQNSFTGIPFKAAGKIMPVIEVVSVDKREELRRSLFAPGKQSN